MLISNHYQKTKKQKTKRLIIYHPTLNVSFSQKKLKDITERQGHFHKNLNDTKKQGKSTV